MKQLTQHLKTGRIRVQDVPTPVARPGGILVRTHMSLISAGTEKMMVSLGKKSLLGKARERPDLVRKVLAKIKRDGFLATMQTVRDKLDSEMPLGYSNCGTVLAVGRDARRFEVGQTVACAGAGYANHAEVNYVPRLLAAPIPRGVSLEAAAYTTVGVIALQGIRLADLRVGESAVVLGLGLIGQLSVQILKASGCRVAAVDVSSDRVRLATELGADLALTLEGEKTERQILDFTRGRGADAVLITAATSSNEPVEQAARLARDRAKVIMVGVTGMDIPRRDYFQKELTFIVSRSYGPGRYDTNYEEHGHDYPVGHVRWTENRNMEAFLDMVASGAVRPEPLTTHRFPIDEADKAFELILQGNEPFLGIILEYPDRPEMEAAGAKLVLKRKEPSSPKQGVGVSFVGAGAFARAMLLPNVARLSSVAMRGVVTASGMSAKASGDKFGFDFCSSEESDVLEDKATDLVFVATPHTQHADGVCRALAAGKAVFVEKPLSVDLPGLARIHRALVEHPELLMVGFNRRFSPLTIEMRDFLAGRGPISVQYRCNAGAAPEGHWIGDPVEGGRIIGEACHFFDFFAFLTGSAPTNVFAAAPSLDSIDDTAVTVTYENGSICQLLYASNGPGSYSKERAEAFAGGTACVLEDFRSLVFHADGKGRKPMKLMKPDKGHAQEISLTVEAVRKGIESPISADSLFDTSLVSLAAVESITSGRVVSIPEMREALLNLTE